MRLNARRRQRRGWRVLWRVVRVLVFVWGIIALLAVIASWPKLMALFELNRTAGAISHAEIEVEFNRRRLGELNLTAEQGKSMVEDRLRQLRVPVTVNLRP